MQLVLASQSPRRIQLLQDLELEFIVDPSQFSEKDDHTTPLELAIHNAEGKAREVALRHPNSIIIAADTIGVITNQPLNKPKDRDDAYRLIKLISGTTHHVITGLHIIKTGPLDATAQNIGSASPASTDHALAGTPNAEGAPQILHEISEQVTTEVTMSALTEEEIQSYLDTNDWHDKAAAYAIQGRGAVFVEYINGDYFNVVGLPIFTLSRILKQLGKPVF